MPLRKRNYNEITQIYHGSIASTRWWPEKFDLSAIRKSHEPILVWKMEGFQGTQRWTDSDEAWLKNELSRYDNLPREKQRQLKMRAHHLAFGGLTKELETQCAERRLIGVIALGASVIAFAVLLACVVYGAFVAVLNPITYAASALAASACLLIGLLAMHSTGRTSAWYQEAYRKQLRYDVLWSELCDREVPPATQDAKNAEC